MFVVNLMSLMPEKKNTIREVFGNYRDFQERWNETAPKYAQDMITVAIKTGPQAQREFSQIPILAWGLERVFQRNGDLELVRQCIAPIERWHDWYWRERDLHDNGLITVGAYTGILQHARWETFDYECNMDDLKHGLSEHYNSMTGEALGVPDYSMASTVLTMMLDGLTKKHKVSLRT